MFANRPCLNVKMSKLKTQRCSFFLKKNRKKATAGTGHCSTLIFLFLKAILPSRDISIQKQHSEIIYCIREYYFKRKFSEGKIPYFSQN